MAENKERGHFSPTLLPRSGGSVCTMEKSHSMPEYRNFSDAVFAV